MTTEQQQAFEEWWSREIQRRVWDHDDKSFAEIVWQAALASRRGPRVPDKPGWWWRDFGTFGVSPVLVEDVDDYLQWSVFLMWMDNADCNNLVEDDGKWRGPCVEPESEVVR